MSQIHELYTLTEGYIITPSELLANAKLPNYDYVKFSNNGRGLHVEASCSTADEAKAIFNYYFDEKDRLQKLVMETMGLSEVIFDRVVEIEKLKSNIRRTKRNSRTRING